MRIGQASFFMDALPGETRGWDDLLSKMICQAIATAWPALTSGAENLAVAERNLHYSGYQIINLTVSLTLPDDSLAAGAEQSLKRLAAAIFLDSDQVGLNTVLNPDVNPFCSIVLLTGKR